MKVGDLVKAVYWGTGYIGLVVRIRPNNDGGIATVMLNSGYLIDQLVKDLEIVDE